MSHKKTSAALLAALALGISAQVPADDDGGKGIRHVLLVSIDGMHSIDFINCARGVSSIDNGTPYCPNLAQLKQHGLNYLDASTSRPSDSFPGLMAIVTGGTPRTFGAFYDVAYDRSLAPPKVDTGNGLTGGSCTSGVFNGTTTEYEEGIDKDQTFLNGVGPGDGDGGVASINPDRLPRDPAHGCAPVFPWNFIRTNTVYGVIHKAGGYTAWSDKHPAYASVAGPNTKGPANVPENLDDYYSPEINSAPPNNPPPPPCTATSDPNFSGLGSYTDSFAFTRCYDQLKVVGVLNQIDGYTHNRSKRAPVPTIFGMNFQAVSVGQKLIEAGVGSGGYSDATGTPSKLLLAQIKYVDGAIGSWVAELNKQGLLDSTLVIITAKHGQSPVDSSRYTRITSTGPVMTSPSQIIDSCLPDSESNAGGQIGPTEDDVSLLWLKAGCSTENEVVALETKSPADANIAGIGQIFWGSALTQMFNAPGLAPKDPRSPDIIVTPNVGVTYSASKKKQAEHGGFAHDDTNVMLLLSNPEFSPRTFTAPVQTAQVAPTLLVALGLDPSDLQAVKLEGTQVLPGLPQRKDD